ncbi:L-alanine exporter AlaE, partial [Candidatus Symbiopectobacterium sp. NZEC135]
TPQQIVAAVTSNVLISRVMGVAYGYFLDYCRRLFRVAVPG